MGNSTRTSIQKELDTRAVSDLTWLCEIGVRHFLTDLISRLKKFEGSLRQPVEAN